MVAVVLSNPHKPQRPLSVIPKLGLYGRCGSFKSTQTAKTIIGYTKTWSIWSPWFFQIHTNSKDHYRLYQNLVYMVAVVLLNPHKPQRPLSVIPKLGLCGRCGSFKSTQTAKTIIGYTKTWSMWSLWFFQIHTNHKDHYRLYQNLVYVVAVVLSNPSKPVFCGRCGSSGFTANRRGGALQTGGGCGQPTSWLQ